VASQSLDGNESLDRPRGLTGYSAERPLILWTDFPPDFQGGGAVVLRSLLRVEDRQRIVWVSPTAARDTDAPRSVRLRPIEEDLGRRRSLFFDSTIFAGSLADETLRIARRCGARALWMVMHGAAVPVAAELIRRTRLPIHLTVHDDPAFGVALRSRRYLALIPWLESCFGFSMRTASSVDVISDGMSERYRTRYGVSSTIVHRALEGPITASSTFDPGSGELRIGVLGNTYQYAQTRVLARALIQASRELNVRGRLTVVGRGHAERLQREFAKTLTIDNADHLEEDQAVELLRECFLLYLNYPFGIRSAVLRRTSFPTKLSTYVLAARPLLIHSPVDSTLMDLGPDREYTHHWDSMDPVDGRKVLLSAWRDAKNFASAHVQAEGVRGRYFDVARNRANIAAVLNSLVSHPRGSEFAGPREG
jgi:hypothetical protein